MDNFTKKELEVATGIVSGLTNLEIAQKLAITEKGVKFHVTRIYAKSQVKNRAQFIVKNLTAIKEVTNG
jgi:DNA-binding NarL/FixJ family response regulator